MVLRQENKSIALDGTRITNVTQKILMEDKIAAGAFRRATNYGREVPFKPFDKITPFPK